MRCAKIILIAMSIGFLAACSSPEEKAAKAQAGSYKAQEEVARERLKLVDQYQQCVEQAGADQMKVEACDSYLKAAEALK